MSNGKVTDVYKFYGIQISYFVGKVRAYLNFKGIPYKEISPTFLDFRRFKKELHASVMPVLETPTGELVDDTTLIIERLEDTYADNSISPTDPIQFYAANFFEAWMDEVGHLIAIHTRWSHEENIPLFKEKMGKATFPWFPRIIRDWLLDKTVVSFIKATRVKLGVIPSQEQALDDWIISLLDLLEIHFSENEYILGGHPSIADYAFIGVCYGHLYTDPWPREHLILPRPHLLDYIERTHRGDSPAQDWNEVQGIPETLFPVLRMASSQLKSIVSQTVDCVTQLISEKALKAGDLLPRFPGEISLPLGQTEYRKATFGYTLWMMQRLKKHYLSMSETDRLTITEWARLSGCLDIENLDCGPPVERFGLKVKLLP